MDDNKEKLEQVYGKTLDAALNAQPGSEEHTAIVNNIVKLGAVIRDDTKLEGEFAENFEKRCDAEKQRTYEETSKQKTQSFEWKKFAIQLGVTVGLAAAGGVFKHIWRCRTFEFEKEGTITTFIGKDIFRDK